MAKSLIYVAGNPSLYPIEYYNSAAKEYQGVIPKLLQQFSEEYGYEIEYYKPGAKDERDQLAVSRQVDVISGCTDEEEFQNVSDQEVVLFSAEEHGETVTYQLLVSSSAPAEFQTEFRQFFSQLSQAEKTGLVMEVQEEQNTGFLQGLSGNMVGFSAALIALLVVLLFFIKRIRKQLKVYEAGRTKDSLTGVSNADYFDQQFKERVNSRNRILYSICCFYIDTDRMARVIGYDNTNNYLRHTASVLQEYVSETELLAYITNIGFVVLRWSGGDIQEDWIRSALYRIRNFSEESRVSAGIYSLMDDDDEPGPAVFNAYVGAVTAYQRDEEYCICTEEVFRDYLEERRLREDLKEAFDRQEFQLYLQFFVDAKNHRIVGGEALTRWQHPEKGFLLPGMFVPMMEKESLIPQMDYYILDKVCAFLDRLNREDIQDVYISCNFSRVTFEEADYVKRCIGIIEKYHFRRSCLIFELTEGLSVRNSVLIRKNVDELRSYGVRFALDDFGEGFTSFFDLQEYPTDYLKLDKSLVDNVMTKQGKMILQTMVEIGHKLNMTVMAEGIESEEQLSELQSVGCDVIQGFYFHYPVPEWDAEKQLLKKREEEKKEKERIAREIARRKKEDAARVRAQKAAQLKKDAERRALMEERIQRLREMADEAEMWEKRRKHDGKR